MPNDWRRYESSSALLLSLSSLLLPGLLDTSKEGRVTQRLVGAAVNDRNGAVGSMDTDGRPFF